MSSRSARRRRARGKRARILDARLGDNRSGAIGSFEEQPDVQVYHRSARAPDWMGDGAVCFEGCDSLGPVGLNTAVAMTAAGDTLINLNVNPHRLGRRLQLVASLYEQYSVLEMELIIRSSLGTQHDGEYIAAGYSDAAQELLGTPATRLALLASTAGFKVRAVRESMAVRLPIATDAEGMPRVYYTADTLEEPRMQSAGLFYAMIAVGGTRTGAAGGVSTLGVAYVRYRIAFRGPTLEPIQTAPAMNPDDGDSFQVTAVAGGFLAGDPITIDDDGTGGRTASMREWQGVTQVGAINCTLGDVLQVDITELDDPAMTYRPGGNPVQIGDTAYLRVATATQTDGGGLVDNTDGTSSAISGVYETLDDCTNGTNPAIASVDVADGESWFSFGNLLSLAVDAVEFIAPFILLKANRIAALNALDPAGHEARMIELREVCESSSLKDSDMIRIVQHANRVVEPAAALRHLNRQGVSIPDRRVARRLRSTIRSRTQPRAQDHGPGRRVARLPTVGGC